MNAAHDPTEPLEAEIEISVILPCFNEEACIRGLTDELRAVLQGIGRSFEILYINDMSTDTSGQILDEMARDNADVRVIHHTVNCGESAAQATGFRFARGEILITMDSDGQNHPDSVPDLVRALDGKDGVCGVRVRREDDFVKRISSKLGNGFRNFVTGDKVSDAGCTFRALRRAALRDIPIFNGMHRFLPTLMRYQGYTVTEIPVLHRPRETGVSKYGVGNRLFRGILDCFAMRWFRRRLVPGQRIDEATAARVVGASR